MIVFFLSFLLLTIIGFVLLRSFINESRLLVLLPAGTVLGVACAITLLNVNFQITQGKGYIAISSVELLTIGFAIFIKFKSGWTNLNIPKNLLYTWLPFLTVTFFLMFIRMSNTLPAADNSLQWIYAASVARENYPLMTPFQPDIFASYHLGLYYLEGALKKLVSLPFPYINALMNTYLLFTNLLLSIMIFWESKYSYKNYILIIAGLVTFVSFGVIILAYPKIISSPDSITVSLFNLDSLLPLIPAKQENGGAPLINLNFLSFLPARSASIALALLLILLSISKFRSKLIKIFSIAFILSVISLVEESMFIPLMLTAGCLMFFSFTPYLSRLYELNKYRSYLFLIVLLTILFSLIQGGVIFDNLFNGSETTFRLVLPFSSREPTLDVFVNEKIAYLNNIHITNFSGFNWFVPNPLIIIVILVVYSLYSQNKIIGSLSLFSIVSFTLFLTFEYIYNLGTSYRFHSFGYLSLGYALCLTIFNYCKTLPLRRFVFLNSIFILVIFLPTLLPVFISEFKIASDNIINRYSSYVLSNPKPQGQLAVIKWASENLPKNARLIALDWNFPTGTASLNFQYEGIYTIVAPLYTRSNRPEPGPEYFDLALTLNPKDFIKTKTRYVYIESESAAYTQLSEMRKKELENPRFFRKLFAIEGVGLNGKQVFLRLYSVNDDFLTSTEVANINEGTLDFLAKQIPKDATVYVSDYPGISFWYRMAISYALRDRKIALNRRDQEYLPFRTPYSGYMLIETYFNIIPDNPDGIYDFYILPPDRSPAKEAKLIWSNMFASAWKRI